MIRSEPQAALVAFAVELDADEPDDDEPDDEDPEDEDPEDEDEPESDFDVEAAAGADSFEDEPADEDAAAAESELLPFRESVR